MVAPNPLRKGKGKRRDTWFALFGYGLIAALVLQPAPAAQNACKLDGAHAHDKVVVEYVYDGDTIRLSDGRKVRLIGINTPELGHDDEPDQPFAEQARTKLRQLAKPYREIRLRYDVQRRDGYGRTLAHLFLVNGTNVQDAMLSSGLATVIAVPPNLWQLECHLASEANARANRRGVWSLPSYQPIDADSLTEKERGFRLIKGRVRRVWKGRKSVRLQLTRDLVMQIPHGDTHYFKAHPPRSLKGRRVLARGWLTPSRGGLSITIRHPSALRVLD